MLKHEISRLEENLSEFQKATREKLSEVWFRLHQLSSGKQGAKAEEPKADMPDQSLMVLREEPTRVKKEASESMDLARGESVKKELKEEVIVESASHIAEEVVGPIGNIIGSIRDTFIHLKKERKLTIFLLTSAGILISLIGLGFLLQYSFEHWFGVWGDLVKVGAGFVGSTALLVWASRLWNRNEKYKDYSSAIMGMGLSVNFLLIYFTTTLGNVLPLIAHPAFGFVMILLNTALAAWMSLKFETKIVMFVSYMGGALCPFYLESSGNPWFYLYFLMALTMSVFRISRIINWVSFQYFTFIMSTAITAIALKETDLSSGLEYIGVVLISELYFFLFAYSAIFNIKRRIREKPFKLDVATMIAGLSLLVGQALLLKDAGYLGWTIPITSNAILAIALLLVFWNRIPLVTKRFVAASTSFLWLALVPMYFSFEVTGFYWALEGLLLLYLGFLLQFKIFRIEALIVLFIAIVLSLPGVASINPVHAFSNNGMLHLALIGAIGIGVNVLYYKKRTELYQWEINVRKLNETLVPIWFIVFAMIASYTLIGSYTYVVGLILILSFIGVSLHYKIRTNEFIGWILFGIVAFVGYTTSVITSGSLPVYEQPWFGKLSVGIPFVTLYAALSGYKYLKSITERNIYILEAVRELFFWLLSLNFLPWIFREHSHFIPMGLAVSYALSLVISYFRQKRSFIVQNHLLLVVMVIATLAENSIGQTVSVIGVMLTAWTILARDKRRYLKDYQGLTAIKWVVVPILLGVVFNQVEKTLVFLPLYLLQLTIVLGLYLKRQPHYWKKRAKSIKWIGIVLMALTLLLEVVFRPQLAGLAALLLGLIILVMYEMRHLNLQVRNWRIGFKWFTINVILAGVYLSILRELGGSMEILATVALSVHGVVLLIASLNKPLGFLEKQGLLFLGVSFLKLFVFDLSGLQSLQRILVFILTGVVLLASAYLFIRLKKKLEGAT